MRGIQSISLDDRCLGPFKAEERNIFETGVVVVGATRSLSLFTFGPGAISLPPTSNGLVV